MGLFFILKHQSFISSFIENTTGVTGVSIL